MIVHSSASAAAKSQISDNAMKITSELTGRLHTFWNWSSFFGACFLSLPLSSLSFSLCQSFYSFSSPLCLSLCWSLSLCISLSFPSSLYPSLSLSSLLTVCQSLYLSLFLSFSHSPVLSLNLYPFINGSFSQQVPVFVHPFRFFGLCQSLSLFFKFHSSQQ